MSRRFKRWTASSRGRIATYPPLARARVRRRALRVAERARISRYRRWYAVGAVLLAFIVLSVLWLSGGSR